MVAGSDLTILKRGLTDRSSLREEQLAVIPLTGRHQPAAHYLMRGGQSPLV
jgi:hypothetical protein